MANNTVNRGKRYAIDTDRLLKDTDIYYLAYKGKLSTELLKTQLKENKLTYYPFHALKDAGFNIEDYWLKDSEINTIQIDEDLFYNMINSTAKYKKLANKINGFMNVKLFKPLKGYLEFCDSINLSYLTLCDDEDYLIYLEELEKKQFRELPKKENPKESHTEEKPKAFIKENAKTNIPAELASIRSEITAIKNFHSILVSEWSDYGEDERSIAQYLSMSPYSWKHGEMNENGLKALSKHYSELKHDLYKAIIAKEIGYPYLPTIPERLLQLDNIINLEKSHRYCND